MISFYSKYLYSTHWRSLRETILKQRNYRCQNCGSKSDLNVHHRNYECLYKETGEDLDVLCSTCHKKSHFSKRNKKRKKYKDVRVKPRNLIKNSEFYFVDSPLTRTCPSCSEQHEIMYVWYFELKLVLRCRKSRPRTKFLKFESGLPIPIIGKQKVKIQKRKYNKTPDNRQKQLNEMTFLRSV